MLSKMLEEEKTKNAKLIALSQNDNKTDDHEITVSMRSSNSFYGVTFF